MEREVKFVAGSSTVVDADSGSITTGFMWNIPDGCYFVSGNEQDGWNVTVETSEGLALPDGATFIIWTA